MEYWSDGGLEYWKKYFVTHHSNTYFYLFPNKLEIDTQKPFC